MNSSIFSSKPLRRWLGLPPRTHAWHALLALGAIAMIAAGSRIAKDADPRSFRHKADLEGIETAEVVVLGNSQFQSLDADNFAMPTKIMGLPGSGFSIQAAVFLTHAPRMPNLKLLLLGFCNVPLLMPDIANREGDFQDISVWGVPWYRIPCISFIDALIYRISYDPWLKPLLVGPNFDIDAPIWKRLPGLPQASAESQAALPANSIDNGVDVTKIEPGFTVPPNGGAQKMGQYLIHLRGSGQRSENIAALYRIIDYCAEHGIEVALLRAPTTYEFWSSRTKGWNDELASLYKDLRARAPRLALPIWDAEHTEVYPDHWFFDPNHMRPEALARYAAYLNERIEAHFDGVVRDDGISSVMSGNGAQAMDALSWNLAEIGEWKMSAGVELEPIPLPDALSGKAQEAMRITLPPGGNLYQADYSQVAPGDTSTVQAWFWTDSPFEDVHGLFLTVSRHPDGSYAAKQLKLKKLEREPQLLQVSCAFERAYPAARFQLSNDTDETIVLYMADPTLLRRVAAGNAPE